MVAKRVCGLFFPHGLGHSVGIDVHDPGDMSVLQENMVLTVEPGIYFNRAFVEIGLKDANKSPFLNVPLISSALHANIGGVRHEDVVLVTATGHEILSVV
jgi:Xaa-Pro dipeptidase